MQSKSKGSARRYYEFKETLDAIFSSSDNYKQKVIESFNDSCTLIESCKIGKYPNFYFPPFGASKDFTRVMVLKERFSYDRINEELMKSSLENPLMYKLTFRRNPKKKNRKKKNGKEKTENAHRQKYSMKDGIFVVRRFRDGNSKHYRKFCRKKFNKKSKNLSSPSLLHLGKMFKKKVSNLNKNISNLNDNISNSNLNFTNMLDLNDNISDFNIKFSNFKIFNSIETDYKKSLLNFKQSISDFSKSILDFNTSITSITPTTILLDEKILNFNNEMKNFNEKLSELNNNVDFSDNVDSDKTDSKIHTLDMDVPYVWVTCYLSSSHPNRESEDDWEDRIGRTCENRGCIEISHLRWENGSSLSNSLEFKKE